MTITLPPDPWQKVKTINDFPADEIISALQKEVRRGNSENACLLAYEMITTSPEMEEKLWIRLMVMSVEDVGFGNTQAPILINTLYEIHNRFSLGALDRPLFALHGVRILCESEKDRSTDEMLNWIKNSGQLPAIPDYAIDMHTGRGFKMGRNIEHFLNEASKVHPEKAERNRTYYDKLRKILLKD
ncbi:MAG: hypothetical protein JEZ06_11315 [Anaerolineaceae bacterium]|nr:hypothetical protein [Anaerolineaceae bacterium]